MEASRFASATRSFVSLASVRRTLGRDFGPLLSQSLKNMHCHAAKVGWRPSDFLGRLRHSTAEVPRMPAYINLKSRFGAPARVQGCKVPGDRFSVGQRGSQLNAMRPTAVLLPLLGSGWRPDAAEQLSVRSLLSHSHDGSFTRRAKGG